jgi:hypothetical protein
MFFRTNAFRTKVIKNKNAYSKIVLDKYHTNKSCFGSKVFLEQTFFRIDQNRFKFV